MDLKILYIDIYFLINFTVDILASYISFKFCNIRVGLKRLFFFGILGALFAVFDILLTNYGFLRILLAIVFTITVFVFAKFTVSAYRSIKFTVAFYISSFLIGGFVNFIYGILDKYFAKYISFDENAENQKILILSLIILLIIGVFRILIMIFSNSISEQMSKLYIKMDDKMIETDALIDSGNLVKDPMNMAPVVFLKKRVAMKIFPEYMMEISDLTNIDINMKRRIRLIPVSRNGSTHMMCGVRVDEVGFIKDNRKAEINATIVIDKEEGTFGGYDALAPYVAFYDV